MVNLKDVYRRGGEQAVRRELAANLAQNLPQLLDIALEYFRLASSIEQSVAITTQAPQPQRGGRRDRSGVDVSKCLTCGNPGYLFVSVSARHGEQVVVAHPDGSSHWITGKLREQGYTLEKIKQWIENEKKPPVRVEQPKTNGASAIEVIDESEPSTAAISALLSGDEPDRQGETTEDRYAPK